MKKINIPRLILSILICFVAAGIGTYFTTPSISGWYASLNKPFFSPPNWIFGPVWTLLYTMMGIALYIVWNKKTKLKKLNSYKYFAWQLFANALWSIVFFGLYNPILAFEVIVVLWILILFTIINFSKISKTAAYLLYPYLAWVSFAAILNLSVAFLN